MNTSGSYSPVPPPPTASAETSPRYLIAQSCAAHCSANGSNKDWIGVLVHLVAQGSDPNAPEPGDARTWMFLSAYGKSGGRLQGGGLVEPQTRLEAARQYHAKVAEKLNKHHYVLMEVQPTQLHAFKVPLEQPPSASTGAVPPASAASSPRVSPSSSTNNGAPSPSSLMVPDAKSSVPLPDAAALSSVDELPYPAAKVEAVDARQAYRVASYGATEKANGERCLLSYDGETMCAYNRAGQRVMPVPAHALILSRLGVPFVLDGERLVGEQANEYVVFDVLCWKSEDVRHWAYRERIKLLINSFQRAELTRTQEATPTLHEARLNALVTGLMLLAPTPGNVEQVVQAVQCVQGEGVILRDLSAPYTRSKGIRKYKFTTDLDAIVLGVKPGTNGGSLRLGLRRPADNALIEVGFVRSGLTPTDMKWFLDQLTHGAGTYPVIKVTYLPARTVGLSLVEPSTSRTWVRTDKTAWECTTEQLGHEKASLIAKAPAASGMKLREPVPAALPAPVAAVLEGADRQQRPPVAAASVDAAIMQAMEAMPAVAPVASIPEISRSQPSSSVRMPVAPQSLAPALVASREAARTSIDQETAPALVAVCATTPQDVALLERCRLHPRTLLVDIRATKARQGEPPSTASQTSAARATATVTLRQDELRRQWGMRYLNVSATLGERHERGSWGTITLIAPEKGVETLCKLLEQQYHLVLLCGTSSKGHKNLAEYIVETYFKGRTDLRLRFPTVQAFAEETQQERAQSAERADLVASR